jgi:hypothetical protein
VPDPRIRIYLDGAPDSVTYQRPPTEIALDTKSRADGEHGLRIEAQDATGRVGVRRLRFRVRNGPGITVTGLGDGAVVHGTVRLTVNAFGAEEPFEPHRAESPSPIPVWVSVLSLLIVAWTAWYVKPLERSGGFRENDNLFHVNESVQIARPPISFRYEHS